jgi:hypothetical protein
MKKLLMLVFFYSCLMCVFAQEKRVNKNVIPEEIKNYLRLNYSEAKEIHYFKKKDKDSLIYEVEFELNREEYNLRFSLQGNLRETEREIELTEIQSSLQQSIKSALDNNFRKFKIRKIQEVNPADNKQYEVYVKVKKDRKFKGGFYKVMFDQSGKLLSIQEEKLYSIESVF